MTQYTNKVFLDRKVNELKRIEKMLVPFPNVIDPNNLSIEHVMLTEERKKLREDVKREAVSSGQRNPLDHDKELLQYANINHTPDNQSLSVNNMHDTSNDTFKLPPMFAADARQEGSRDTNGKVPSDERRRACEALRPNGCGGKGFWKGSWAPDTPGGFDFTEACNTHDRNYSILGFGFERANEIFFDDMMAVVRAQEKPGSSRYLVGRSHAKTYRNYVMNNGRKYYDDAQKNAYICKYGTRPK